jgi:ATP-dependent RNA helicase RhlE
VPNVPDDYIHRVGRTARAELTGEAFTLVAPEEEADFGRIERAVSQPIPRLRLEGFAYGAAPDQPLEVPLQERISAIRARKAEDRARAAAKAARTAQGGGERGSGGGRGASRRGSGRGR